MSKRRIAITSAVLVGLTVSATIPSAILQKRPIISLERYERLTKGMTLKDVESFLGGPPGDYRTLEVWCKFMTIPPPQLIWMGNESAIEPHFDADGRMEFATYYGMERMTTFDLPWHRRIWNQLRNKIGI
jgi:hypothetical protein